MTAAAGWYDDPLIPGGKRYWDGGQWTEHAQAPPAGPPGGAGQAPPQGGPPPFGPSAMAEQTYATGSGGQINDVGEWIGRSFRMVLQQIGPLAVFFAVQFAFLAVAYMLADQALRGLAITDGGDVLGFNGGLVFATVVVLVMAVLAAAAALLAGHHNLYGAHIGRPPSWGESLSAGFSRMLRLIGIMILLYLTMYLLIALAVGVIIAMAYLLGDNAVIVIPLVIVLYIGTIVFLMWASVKLGFIVVATAVVPAGTSAIKAAWNTTTGFFWPILGRTLLLGLVVGAMFMVPYVLAILVVPALFFSQFGLLEDGSLTIDGRPVDTLDVLEFADVLPNPVAMIVFFGVLLFLFTMIQTVAYSGSTALYADLGGPNSFSHGGR